MNQQQPARPLPAGRRADTGTVRLTGRDISGLILAAEQYGTPYDLLAAALDVRGDRLRGILARWRRAGYAATGTLGPGPPWCWLTPAGMAVTGLAYPAIPSGSQPAGAYPRGAGRPAVAPGRAGLPGRAGVVAQRTPDPRRDRRPGRPPRAQQNPAGPNPVYGPVIALIYRWRVQDRLGKPTIRARLAAGPNPTRRPAAGWSLALVDEILSNPKYTGHQVMGRRRRKGHTKVWMPASEWIWSAEPTHAALVDMATWDEAQRIGRRHGNVRDPEMPTTRAGRRYKLRSRLYCSICHRRLSGTTIRAYTYYRCPHEPGLPRHYAAYPDHRTVAVRETIMMDALARFFTERVFGPDRAAMLTAHIPASAAAPNSAATTKPRPSAASSPKSTPPKTP